MDVTRKGKQMRRIILGAGIVAFALVVPGRSWAQTGYALPTKKVCHKVTKTVHGKKQKVKVCKSVKPTPTATSTPPPTPSPTPTPTNTPTPRFSTAQSADGAHHLVDSATGAEAIAFKWEYDGQDEFGISADAAHRYLYVQVGEIAHSVGAYSSSRSNFAVVDASGMIYTAFLEEPYLNPDPGFGAASIEGSLENKGWVRFFVPTPGPGASYTLMWNEDGAVPWTPVTPLASGE